MSGRLEVPTTPQPKRLNRLGLIAVIAVLGVALTAVFMTLAPAKHKLPTEPEPTVAQPAFLDHAPVVPPPAPRTEPPAASQAYWDEALRQAQAANAAASAPAWDGAAGAAGAPAGGGAGDANGTVARPPASQTSPREDAFRRALVAPVAPTRTTESGSTEGEWGALRQGAGGPFVPQALPPSVIPQDAGTAAASPVSSGGRTDHSAFVRASEILAPTDLKIRRDVGPGASYVLDAGTVIPAALETAVNSDLPGPLVAQVTRDVFDRDQRRVLIPRGSRLLGEYDSQIALGESRLLVAWSRVIFPNGAGLSFPGLPATTQSGEAGLKGSVNNHLARVFGSALLLSIVSAGAQLSQPQESATFGAAPSTRQVAAAAVGQELSSVGIELLRREMSVPPTIQIQAGTSFYVFLKGDVALNPYEN